MDTASFLLNTKIMDVSPQTNTYSYFITLTSPEGFTGAQVSLITDWHRVHSEKCILVEELHDSGKNHTHSLICCQSPKLPANVTRNLLRLYAAMDIEPVKGVSIVTKKVTDFVGMLHYLTKDLAPGATPLLCMGWAYSWIKQQIVDGIMHMPRSMLRKDQYMVQSSSSVQLIVQYARAAGFPLTGKQCFITVCTDMQSKGYQFEKIKPKWLYAQVMAMTGHEALARRVWEDALFGLD